MKLRINVLGGKLQWDEQGNIETNWKYSDSFDITLTDEQAAMVRMAQSCPEWEITGRPL